MQGAEGTGALGRGAGEDDMVEGDLGDGGGLRSGATSSRGNAEQQLPRSALRKAGSDAAFSWTSGESLNSTLKQEFEACQPSLCWRDTDTLSELSRGQLMIRVQELSEEVALLRCELEVKHRHLEGKQEALKILQGQAILDKATSHTRMLLLKSEQRTKTLEKEMNVLQWEITFNQAQFKNFQQSWEQKYNRVCSENQALSDSLAQRGAELQALRSENYTLNQQCLELVSTLQLREQRAIQGIRLPCGQEGEGDSLEPVVLCPCHGEGLCQCAHSTSAARKQLLQLTQELEAQSRGREEAVVVADAFRIAFEQQLQRRNDFLLLTDTNRKCPPHKTEEGVGKRNSVSVGQRLRALLSSSTEAQRLQPPTDTLHSLLDMLNDKEEALAHQRKVILMLAHNTEELERRLQNSNPTHHHDNTRCSESMSDRTLEYFVSKGRLSAPDAANVLWVHAANSREKITAALTGPAHMIEADVLMRGHDPREPIMAHPPETDSDITLHDWLKQVAASDKGIKLDFKSLQAVAPSMVLLQQVQFHGPVWLNADILPGPGGQALPLEPQAFLEAVGSQDHILSLGWTTGWVAGTDNPGYSWEMVRRMEEVCRDLKQPVTFPVRAALLPQSVPQLDWLLQKSHRYSLTVWTGLTDVIKVNSLLTYRKKFEKSQIYYDLLDSQRSEFRALPGYF